jgi:hypothetical protein
MSKIVFGVQFEVDATATLFTGAIVSHTTDPMFVLGAVLSMKDGIVAVRWAESDIISYMQQHELVFLRLLGALE